MLAVKIMQLCSCRILACADHIVIFICGDGFKVQIKVSCVVTCAGGGVMEQL